MGQWDGTGNSKAYLLHQNSSSQTQAYVSSTGTNQAVATVANSTAGIADDEWHHYVLQFSTSDQDNFIRIWIDGQYWETGSVGYASLHNSTARLNSAVCSFVACSSTCSVVSILPSRHRIQDELINRRVKGFILPHSFIIPVNVSEQKQLVIWEGL